MKKKVFSLMMMLVLAFTGMARASEVTVYDGTATSNYVPAYVFYFDDFTRSQFVIPADDLTSMIGSTINGVKFYTTSSYMPYTTVSTVDVYLKEVDYTSISDFEAKANCQMVYTGTLDFVAEDNGGSCVITFSTPFIYNGGNLLVGCENTTDAGYKNIYFYGQTVNGASVAGSNSTSLDNVTATQRNFIPKTTFILNGGGGGGGGGSTNAQIFPVQNGEVVETVYVGARPNGCWMEPFTFQIRNTGSSTRITTLDWTPAEYFTVVAPELPVLIGHNEDIDVQLTTGSTSNTEWQMVAIYGTGRTAAVWDIVAEPYNPAIPDVWEMAYNLGTLNDGFSYTGIPSQITPTVLHNDYTLPFPQIPEGVDAVYKFTVDSDMILDAYVDANAQNGKVALYREGFEGEGGPMSDNNYQGLSASGGSTGGMYVAMIGDETNTSYTQYTPYYTLYKYSISEVLFTAAELAEAGVTTAPMGSLSWDALEVTTTQTQNNISIWMANVDDVELTTTSHSAADMTLVYTGNTPIPPTGWNEFVFNEGNFAWDGHSNVLILCQRNNGEWNGHVYWRSHNPGFYGMTYKYTDSTPYDVMTQTYDVTRSNTSRPNTILKSVGRNEAPRTALEVSAGPVINNLGLTPGTYYLVTSATQADYTVYINAEDMPCPAIDADGFAFNPQPADNEDEVEPASVTLRWMVPEYATGWRLIFGSTYYPEVGHSQTVIYPEDGSFTRNMSNSYTVRNLWNNTNYFWRVEFNNDACPDGVSSPVWGFTTHFNIPQNLTVVDETVFDDETITLNWSSIQDRTFRTYWIYRDGVKIGETNTNQVNATTYTDGPLAYNMTGYHYYVTAIYDEGESAPSNEVIVKVSGYGNVNGHVYEQDGETGIANATVTMVGQDEFGVNHTYNFTTNGQGYYTGTLYAGEYDGSASCNGYFTINEPIQGNPITIVYNQTTTPIDYMLDENFDPVCAVIAEYYPDSLDSNSPYVKVYWGCGLPGSEIIEPFETGDFSLFDWQIDPTYPWSITTHQPYEGTYCMKSGGAGVASVTSNMTVSVEIPADGIMSFFGKISSESSFDFGRFYIDGVEKGSWSGAGNWAERTYDITAGTHTFQWRYTKDSSVNSNDDCFYVDYISFYKQPEPLQPGWHTYCEAEFDNAYRSTVSTCSWGYEYPVSVASQFAGWNLTKVALFSDDMYGAVGGNFTCNVYVGGNTPAAGTLASTMTVDVPCSQGDWVEYNLTTPVSVTGTEPIWVLWSENVAGCLGYPAGCSTGSNDHGDWWNNGQDGWTHQSGVIWTMKNYFTNRAGRTVALGAAELANAQGVSSKLRTFAKGEVDNTAECINPNPVVVPMTQNNNSRAFSHYRVYRTNCYNDGPYTEENTMLLSCELTDTVYIDTYWADPQLTPPGVYKWGVGVVYVGNRGEEIESPIAWSEPVAVTPVNPEMANRDQVFDFENGMIPSDWTNDATYPWTVVNTAPQPGFNGTYCIKNGNSGVANSTSSISTTVNYTEAGTVSFLGGFWGEGSSDTYDWDKCRFYIDGTVMIDYGAHQAWENVSFNVAAGQHIFTWTYKKDGSVNPTGDAFFVDDVTFSAAGGGGGGGQGGDPGTNGGHEPIQEPRESEIVWSNCLDKDMYLDRVTVNVLLNSADNPEGTTVDFTNLNEVEQQNYPIEQLVLDETGFYAFETFRRGDYAIKVRHEGYEAIDDTVSIWENTDLRYVMIEILFGTRNLYVSRTGWAMWEDDPTIPSGNGGNAQANIVVDFEEGAMPEGWTVEGNGTWTVGTGDYSASTGAHGGTYNAKCTHASSGNMTYLVSPVMNLAGVSSATVNCWFVNRSWIGDIDEFGVYYRVNGGTWTELYHTASAHETWTEMGAVALTGMANGYQLGFLMNDHYGYGVGLDDITVDFGRSEGDRHFEYYKVMCTSIDGVPIYNHNTVWPFCQLSVNEPYNAPLVEGEHYLCKVASVYSTGMSAWSEPVEWEYEPCDHWGPVDEVTVNTTSQGNHIEWVFDHGFNPYGGDTPGPGPQPGNNATVILTAGDVWGDGSGYQMLLDADANAYGTIIPETGALSTNCSGNEAIYAEFEYKIPTNADGNCSTQNMVMNNSVSISIPAGTYDWCITNPTPGDRIWIASAQGNVGGRQNDYVFEAGMTYEFSISMQGSNDAVNVVISGGGKNTVAPLACGEVKDIANVTPIKGGLNFAKGGEFYTQYAEDGIMLNFFAIDNVDFRAFMLYNLSKDSRFSLIPEDEYGQFILTSTSVGNFMDEFETVYRNSVADFNLMSKVDIDDRLAEWKNGVSPTNLVSIMMDVMINTNRPDNDHCINSLPFCTSEVIQFEAASTDNTADEPNMDDGCIGSSYNPSFYHMRIHTAGPFVIHMEGHDPNNGTNRDIDFCMWGPYTEQEIVSGTACQNLTTNKIMDCCYSAQYDEDCYLGYTAEQHNHHGSSTSHGTINYHMPEVGEYYILMITNFSRQPCSISFTKTEGEGETDCDIVIPTDLIGFLITEDGEYVAFAGPDDREYTVEGEFGDHEYCVRPIYPGTMVLPDHNYGWSMGCPVCSTPNGESVCEPGAPINAEQVSDQQIKIWWGEQPQPSEPFFDDFESGDFNGWTAIRAGEGNEYTDWRVVNSETLFSSGPIPAHSGSYVAMSRSWNSTAFHADNWLISPQVSLNGMLSYWVLDDGEYHEHYEVHVSTTTNDINAFSLLYQPGSASANWTEHTVDLSSYNGQMGYIAFRLYDYDQDYLFIDDVMIGARAKSRANIVRYNIYRSTEAAGEYSLINSVEETGATYYEYIDTPVEAGTYYYQVRALYSDGCESEPAMAADGSGNNYVSGSTIGDGLDENSGMAIYPNPTKGNVTIEANGMSHITVVSMVGQVVFDADVENDTYILNMAQFTAGMYTVRVTTENGVNVSRITVVR